MWRVSCFILAPEVSPLLRLAAACYLLTACGSTALPEPAPARQPRSEYLPVPYPPPAGFAEVVPPQPNGDAVWIDGHWAWRGRKYVWERGGWVVPPAGARYAHWRVRYAQDGTLLFAEEVWYDTKLKPMASPATALPAYSPPNELTPESQHGF